jgi:hypothetical protein
LHQILIAIRLSQQLISQKIQPYQEEEKQRAITIIQNIATSSFRFASLASGAHQIYTRVEEWKDARAAKTVKSTLYLSQLMIYSYYHDS